MWHEFVEKFIIPDTFVGLSIKHWDNKIFFTPEEFQGYTKIPNDVDVYFTPAQRKERKGDKKSVAASKFGWVDCDDLPDIKTYDGLLLPTYVVGSGHGHHCYFKLTKPLTDIKEIEQVNLILAGSITGGSTKESNADRVLRVPQTINTKLKGEPKPVELVINNGTIEYTYQEILALGVIDPDVVDLVKSGDADDFPSRSERDWLIIRELIKVGFTEQTVKQMFDRFPCGDKYRNEKNPEHYWETTYKKASTTVHENKTPTKLKKTKTNNLSTAWEQNSAGIWKGDRRITTFQIKPVRVLVGSQFGAQDALICDIITPAGTTNNVTFSKDAFSSASKFAACLLSMDWQLMGNDQDVKAMLPYLLESNSIPKVIAHKVLGLHKINDVWYQLGNDTTLNSQGVTEDIKWIPSKTDVPRMHYALGAQHTKEIGELLPKINDSDVIWPIIGWFTAVSIKPWLMANNYRYPILDITGTRGSGKTTTVKLFQKIFGQTPKVYDGKTTRFVMLSLLGSTNNIPISFSEFREESVQNIIRFILLGYDGSRDSRGRGDQTTVEYELTAPFTIDGEDLPQDPAAQQRLIVAQLSPNSLEAHRHHFKLMQEVETDGFAGDFFQYVLNLLQTNEIRSLLNQAEGEFNEYFISNLPDRVRNNHIVMWLGIKLFCAFTGCELPSIELFNKSIDAIRNRVIADMFIENVVNEIAAKKTNYPFEYDEATNILYIQLNPWHSWWLAKMKREGRNTFELSAIRTQLQEAKYFTGVSVKAKTAMVGIHLKMAADFGLEVPEELKLKEVKINL